MAAAQRHVTLVSADLDLLANLLDAPIRPDAHHHGRLAAAVSDGLQLAELVRQREQFINGTPSNIVNPDALKVIRG